MFARGVVNAVDYPTRQAFVMEIVGADRVVNAVSLNSVLIHAARIAGPAFAGLLIATVGVEPCFVLNAASFAVMIAALAGMDVDACGRRRSSRAGRGASPAGLRARDAPALDPARTDGDRGHLGFNFQAILPLLARFTFDGGASAYAALVTAMGIGAVVGALANGARATVTPRCSPAPRSSSARWRCSRPGRPSLGLEMLVLARSEQPA